MMTVTRTPRTAGAETATTRYERGTPKGKEDIAMELLTRNIFRAEQKLMERLDRQDELLAIKTENGQPASRKHPPFRQSGPVHAAPDKQAHTQPTAASVHCPTRTLAKTYYSEEDVLTSFQHISRTSKKEDIAFYKARIHNFFHIITH